MADTVLRVIPSDLGVPAEEWPRSSGPQTSIVYFVPQLTVGGAEYVLAQLLECLDRIRFRPLVWCPGPWGPIGDRLREGGIPVFRIQLSAYRPRSFLRSVRWLRRSRPEIFHSFGHADHWLDILAARLAGIPVCITSRHNIRHWDPQQRRRWGERLRNRWAQRVVAVSHAVATVCAEVERIPRDHIRMIYNGVELWEQRRTSEYRRRLGLGASDLLLGNVANLKRVKGQDVLLRAFQEVAHEIPHAYLAICGDGEEREPLERLCAQLGLAGKVFFLGLREDLEEIYPSLDLYVHPSHAEGLPTSVLEAMASGLPVVATAAGGTPELFACDDEECLVPPGDHSTLAKALLRLLKDDGMRTRKGAANRRRVAAGFTTARMVAEYESLYLELLRTRKAPA